MRSGRQISIWLSLEEVELAEQAAKREGCSRNEMFRRMIRGYRSPRGTDKSIAPKR